MNHDGHKSGRCGTAGSSGPNSNLVISFSDDESSSDSDEGRQDKRSQDKAKTGRMNGNQKPPILARKTLKKLRDPTQEVKQKTMSKGLTSSRTYIHPRTKNQGVNNRIGSAPSIGQGSAGRSLSMLNQKPECQEHGSDHVVGSRNFELQDLRQQIALRENELKLKLAHQNKHPPVGTFKNSSLNLNRNSGGMSITTCADLPRSVHLPRLDTKEPPHKRLKVGESSYAQRSVEQASTAAILCRPPKDLLLETSKTDKVDYGPKTNFTDKTEPSVTRCEMQDSERVAMASANLHGITAADHPERTSKMVNACSLSKQNLPLTRMTEHKCTNNMCTGMETNHLRISDGRDVMGSEPNQIRRELELVKGSKDDEVLTGGHAVEASLKNSLEGPLKNMSTLSDLDNLKGPKPGIMEMQSLIEMEESLDKKLEEAQEQRRRCEIEERNALKAYRKAQRDLIEANAKCAQLYHQREFYSSRLQSFIVDDTGFWSSLHNKHLGVEVKSSDNLILNVNSLPSSSHIMQEEYDQSNQPGYTSNIGCLEGVPDDSPHLLVNGSEQCSEPDASTSEPLSHKGRRGGNEEFSPLIGQNRPVDEEDAYLPLGHDFVQSKQGSQREGQKAGERHDRMINEVTMKISDNRSRDFLLHEATLRSKLVARLGTKNSHHQKDSRSLEASIEQGSESDAGSEKTNMSNWSAPLERVRHVDFEGTNKVEGRPHEVVQEDESRMSLDHSASIIRSAFYHVKDLSLFKLSSSQLKRHMCFVRKDEGVSIYSSTSSSNETGGDLLSEDAACYSCNVAVDPLWPLCMYELRGKCNNDECPWQHIKDCSDGKMHQNLYSDTNDCCIESTSKAKIWAVPTSHLKCCSPTYVVGLDTLKADSRSYEAVVTQNIGQCWQKCFSISLAISSLPKQVQHLDDSVLQNSEGRIEISGCQSRQSSFFWNRNGDLKVNQASIDGQPLEMALLLLNQDGNKLERKKKALTMLSRALEADPASVVLWSVYLVIYYSEMKTAGEDDMYNLAVKYNQGSYELWLMYINSRSKLEDRLHAYKDALLALCHHSSASNGQASMCILDLFLQMVNCFYLCGRVDKAIEMICKTLPSAENSDERFTLLLSNILSRLTIADKCIFWICCVYLVIYRKLPDAIVQQFECEKELLLIDWPSAHLRQDDRQRALDLVDFAVRCDITEASLADEANVRLAQRFAVNHFRCAVVLNGLNCNRYLLQRFETMYPTSLELLLLSARAGECDFENFSFSGFENALSKWPREAPGLHCIWNQFAQYALQNGRHDYAKDIMDRWFLSAWQVKYPHDEGMAGMEQDNSHSFPSQVDGHAAASSYGRLDEIFGFLNLSLHKLLQKQLAEARIVIDKALRVATPENYKLCVREHARFLLMDETVAKEGAQISGILDSMSVYLNDPRAFPGMEMLPRKFIGDIKRTRVQQLIKNILCPVSCNFSLVNLVLEVWCGPSLLPQEFDKPDHLVDFVEAMLEISPSNYPLAISVGKLIKRDYKSSAVTSASLFFWASSILVSTISRAVPVAPEYAWAEAAAFLEDVAGINAILDGFYKRALSVYPFSIKLWNSFLISMKSEKDSSSVVRAAEEKGIEADLEFLSTIIG